jgi:PadR family transcriptional regulator PadR
VSEEDLRKFRKELVSGIAALVLLNLLAKADGERYGYEISKELSDKAGDEPLFKQSALYPVLRQLESTGLLSSRVQVSLSGPPRRYYAITQRGRQVLDLWTDTWGKMRDFVDQSLVGKE